VTEDLPEDTPYTTLKERLLETHTLSNFEKLELLFKAGQLGARKPSQLLNSMLEYCPQGEERGVFFHFMFFPPASASVPADPVRRGGAW
jgi:hypothetical protein